jgi:hypothetical protein
MHVEDGFFMNHFLNQLTDYKIGNIFEQVGNSLSFYSFKGFIQVLSYLGIILKKILLMDLSILLHPNITRLVPYYCGGMIGTWQGNNTLLNHGKGYYGKVIDSSGFFCVDFLSKLNGLEFHVRA